MTGRTVTVAGLVVRGALRAAPLGVRADGDERGHAGIGKEPPPPVNTVRSKHRRLLQWGGPATGALSRHDRATIFLRGFVRQAERLPRLSLRAYGVS